MSKKIQKAISIGTSLATVIGMSGIVALVPAIAVGATYADGALITGAGDPNVYVVNNNLKVWVRSAAVFDASGYDWDAIQTVSDISAVPDADLIKTADNPDVYRWENLFKRKLASIEIFNDYSLDWDKIATVTQSVMDSYPGVVLVSPVNSPDLYRVDSGVRQKYLSYEAFVGQGMSDKDVIEISIMEFGSYAEGTPIDVDDDIIDPPVVTGGLTVSLASDTPDSATVATGANADFTKLVLTGTAEISSLYVTLTGQSTSSDIENIKVVDEDGINLGSTGSLDVNNRSLITFSPAWEISGSKDVYLRAGIPGSGATAGRTLALGIATADDITANVDSVVVNSGTGNLMSVVSLSVATVTASADGTTSDSAPDVGDDDVVVNKFKVENDSIEDVVIESMEVMESGTAGLNDISNIELYSVTDSKTLATAASWGANSKVTFTGLDLTISKGETHRFQIKVDIEDGTSLTINADLVDGTDVLMTVKGQKYGYYITVARGSSWDGLGSSNQTIASGAVLISRSSSSAAVGNVTQADEQELATFDIDVRGEQVRISSMTVALDLGTMTESEVSNVRIYDETNDQTHGPYSVTTTDLTDDASTVFEAQVTTTDLVILPVGIHKFTVSAKIATGTLAGDTILAAYPDPDEYFTIKGDTSNNSITATTTTTVSGNTQTVAAGAFTATTLTSPATASVGVGAQDVLLLTASLDTGNSGEDVEFSAMIVEDTMDAAGSNGDDWTGLEVWADLNSDSSTRGDVYETKIAIAPSGQPDDTTATDELITFTFDTNITVSKNSYVVVAVFGDLKSAATADDTHTWSIDQAEDAVTATGVSTGTEITGVTPTGAGQTLTIASGGTLTVAIESNDPVATLLVGESKNVPLAKFRLSETGNVEDLDLDSFKITDDGSDDTVETYYLYNGDNLIGTKAGGAAVEFFFDDGTVTIPQNKSVILTVKADIKAVDGSTVTNASSLTVTVAATGDVDTTGVDSGTAVDSTDTSVDAAIHKVYESIPSVAFASGWSESDTGKDLTASSTVRVARINITADAAERISFGTNASTSLTVQAEVYAADVDSSAGNWTLRDSTGTTVATTSVSDATAASAQTQEVTFNVTTAFHISAGVTSYVDVYADLSDFEDDGDSFQLWLDNTAGDIAWTIDDGSSAYNDGDKILSGDPMSVSFVNPS
ncbi:hypothetical protein CL633_01730 [bacterium]|nr:hypothetical protein [bacterium]|tara:strand:+ start:2399 stop:5920 length:3522 start_codon:yes stop_codon:yes gene_type:complete